MHVGFSWWAVVFCIIALRIWWIYEHPQIIRDADESPYLIRYFIWRPDWLDKIGIPSKKAGRIYLHKFIRSDHDRCLHDHPWNYCSFILKNGYFEHADVRQLPRKEQARKQWAWAGGIEWRKRIKPLRFVRRAAGWRHRVVLLTDKEGNYIPAWTLFFVGPKVREWGFWTGLRKWCHHRAYNLSHGICNEPEKEF